MLRLRSMSTPAWLRDPRAWAAGGISLLLLASLLFWAIRAHQRTEARDTLNAYEPFSNPPLELLFPASVADQPGASDLLEPGSRERIWAVRQRGGRVPSLEVRLTSDGRRWFSTVGNRIIATFKAGERSVTRILSLGGTFPSRQIGFEYSWSSLHPAMKIFGEDAPAPGETYEGEALLYYENDAWRVLHWSTPDFDHAVERFRSLAPARR